MCFSGASVMRPHPLARRPSRQGGTYLAKKAWSGVLTKLRKRKGEDAIGDEEPKTGDVKGASPEDQAKAAPAETHKEPDPAPAPTPAQDPAPASAAPANDTK